MNYDDVFIVILTVLRRIFILNTVCYIISKSIIFSWFALYNVNRVIPNIVIIKYMYIRIHVNVNCLDKIKIIGMIGILLLTWNNISLWTTISIFLLVLVFEL